MNDVYSFYFIFCVFVFFLSFDVVVVVGFVYVFYPVRFYLPYIMHIAHGQRRHFKGAFNAIIPRVLTVCYWYKQHIYLYIGCSAATIAWLYAALNTNKWLILASMINNTWI